MADTLEYILKLQADSFVGGANKGKDALGRFKREVGDADSVVNKLQSRMASITTKFAAFGAAAAGGIGLAALIRRGFEFNKTMGDSEIAIGKVIQQFQGLDEQASKKVAADAIQQLIDLEPQAAGGLKELTEGFLSTVGAAQGLGISVQDNIELVGMFSNAMSNAKIPAEQLSQEMRSILTGNIGADSTLAKVLNISNEDIARAREAGNVVEFIKGKIGVLGQAGDTAEVAFSSLTSAIDKALGATTASMFDVTLDGAKSLTDLINEGSKSWETLGEAGGSALATLIEGLASLATPLSQAINGLDVIGREIGVVAGFAGAMLAGSTPEQASQFIQETLAEQDDAKKAGEAERLRKKAENEKLKKRKAEAQAIAEEAKNGPEHIGLDEINRLFEEEGRKAKVEMAPDPTFESGTQKADLLGDSFLEPAGGPPPRPATERFQEAIADTTNAMSVAEEVTRERDSAFDGKRRTIKGLTGDAFRRAGGGRSTSLNINRGPLSRGGGSLAAVMGEVAPQIEAAGEAKARVTRRQAEKQAKEQAARAAEPRWDLVEKIADIMGGIKGA